MYPYWSNNGGWLNVNDMLSNSLNLFSTAIGLTNVEENRLQSKQQQELLEAIIEQTKKFDIRLNNIENQIQLLLNKLDP